MHAQVQLRSRVHGEVQERSREESRREQTSELRRLCHLSFDIGYSSFVIRHSHPAYLAHGEVILERLRLSGRQD
jgi:hypothetical protein